MYLGRYVPHSRSFRPLIYLCHSWNLHHRLGRDSPRLTPTSIELGRSVPGSPSSRPHSWNPHHRLGRDSPRLTPTSIELGRSVPGSPSSRPYSWIPHHRLGRDSARLTPTSIELGRSVPGSPSSRPHSWNPHHRASRESPRASGESPRLTLPLVKQCLGSWSLLYQMSCVTVECVVVCMRMKLKKKSSGFLVIFVLDGFMVFV